MIDIITSLANAAVVVFAGAVIGRWLGTLPRRISAPVIAVLAVVGVVLWAYEVGWL